ncbi:hypothetical protein TNIN_164071 [Trichonephila inaurata madagascariensis]|uniref:Uncharacterized protein n=1 Tax=Trichonephila inaurata madagascariensis TaxID=2747483 RepID=A0A8X6YKD6_9ARAC|nr:hypothetical protein TNIN_164071 [Trichonephila inaurata madagascariensis]
MEAGPEEWRFYEEYGVVLRERRPEVVVPTKRTDKSRDSYAIWSKETVILYRQLATSTCRHTSEELGSLFTAAAAKDEPTAVSRLRIYQECLDALIKKVEEQQRAHLTPGYTKRGLHFHLTPH